jgi:hypothetical protein
MNPQIAEHRPPVTAATPAECASPRSPIRSGNSRSALAHPHDCRGFANCSVAETDPTAQRSSWRQASCMKGNAYQNRQKGSALSSLSAMSPCVIKGLHILL